MDQHINLNLIYFSMIDIIHFNIFHSIGGNSLEIWLGQGGVYFAGGK